MRRYIQTLAAAMLTATLGAAHAEELRFATLSDYESVVGDPAVIHRLGEPFADLAAAANDAEIILVQRDEPITGPTQSEQIIRERVASQQQQGLYGPRYNSSQSYFGTNSLLGQAYGGLTPFGYVQPTQRFSVSLAQTVDYVTNLALPFAITPNTAVLPAFQNDMQFQTNVYAQSVWYSDSRQSFVTAFNFYQSLHPTVEQIDLWAYTGLSRYTRAITDNLTFYVESDFTYYMLDHNSLLSRYRGGPGLAVRTWDRVSWLGNYNYFDNKFRADNNQSSIAHFFQLQRYQYFGERNHFVLGGYTYGHNNAILDAWTYDLNSAYGGGGLNFGRTNRNQLFGLVSYGQYTFLGFDLFEPGVRRNDDIWTYTARASRLVTNNVSIFAQFTNFSSNSNVARQDFQSQIYSIGAVGTW